MAHHLAVFLLTILLCGAADGVSVTNGSHFIHVICNYRDYQDGGHLSISLNPSLLYQVPVNKTCTVRDISSVTIYSNDIGCYANVTCSNQLDIVSSIGLGFKDVTVSISNIQFIGCGALLSGFDENMTHHLNTSSLYFNSNHSGLLVFVNCSVNVSNVTMKCVGFCSVLMNPRDSLLDKVTTTSFKNIVNGGSGFMIVYDHLLSHQPLICPQMVFHSCFFHDNLAYYPSNSQQCLSMVYADTSSRNPVVNSGALSIFFNHLDSVSCHPLIRIDSSKINANHGNFGGGLMIVMLNTSRGRVEIDETLINNNFNMIRQECGGMAVNMYASTNLELDILPLKVTNTIFNGNVGVNGIYFTNGMSYGIVSVNILHVSLLFTVHFKNVTFSGNRGGQFGGCMTVTSQTNARVYVILESISAHTNQAQLFHDFPVPDNGIFVFQNIHSVIVNGSNAYPSIFYYNKGSSIFTSDSNVYLSGTVSFHDNLARNGAALNMRNSYLHLQDSLHLTFAANRAIEFGGAIFITHDLFAGKVHCVIQYSASLPCSNIVFINNTAGLSGSSIYAFPIYNCYIHSDKVLELSFYNCCFVDGSPSSFRQQHNRSLLSTHAVEFRKCFKHGLRFYPGATIFINVAAFDSAGNSVYTVAGMFIRSNNLHKGLVFNFSDSEKYQVINEVNQTMNETCSVVKATIVLPPGFKNDGVFNNDGVLVMLTPNTNSYVSFSKFSVLLEKCPPGFVLVNGACNCSGTVKAFFDHTRYLIGTCDINAVSISIPPQTTPWIGVSPDSGQFIVATSCPLEYHNHIPEYSSLQYVESSQSYITVTLMNSSWTTELCRHFRVGVMCGRCKEGYSSVFGSVQCKKCHSYRWIPVLLGYIIAGPLILLLIYALKLTLTSGTLNGVILFGQASNAGLIQSLILINHKTHRHDLLVIFLSVLNLSTGYPTCFYNGMDEYWKRVILLVFPMYLLAIVGLVIFLCRYFTWLSRKFSPYSTQILITVVHITISRLLSMVIDVAVPVKVFTDNGTVFVWDRDGSIGYFSMPHALLFSVTLLIVGSVLIPYLVVLLCGHYCMRKWPRCSLYIRPVLDAIQAPYKPKHQYWFSLRLLFIILLYVVYGGSIAFSFTNFFLIMTGLLLFLLVTQAFLQPMKNRLLAIIDVYFILITTVCYFVLFLFFLRQSISLTLTIVFFSSLYLAMFSFLCIIFYHVMKVIGLLKYVTSLATKVHSFTRSLLKRKVRNINRRPNFYHSEFHDVSASYREPLLDDTDD